MTEAESQARLERLIKEIRAQIAAARPHGQIQVVIQLDGARRVTQQSHVRPSWVYPLRGRRP